MLDKLETVRKILRAMKVEERENGYYIRFRKSKSNKIMLDDLFEYEDVMEEDGWERIGEYELMITEERFEELYDSYMRKLFARER